MKWLALVLMLVASPCLADQKVVQKLQDASVTIKANGGEGSGVIITRNVDGQSLNFVWTAAHVVDSLRKERQTVDPATGQKKTVIEFDDAQIVKEITESGRRVGELKMDARVIRYSNADTGQDLALLLIRKRDFVPDAGIKFTEQEIVPIGAELYHVGSLLGQMGANSLTRGVMSQVGRVYLDRVYDQTTVTAFPGSSGGGVFDEEGNYVGMLVRGAGEGFNLIVPARRMREYAKEAGIEFALDEKAEVPHLKDLIKSPVETK
jgi:S1-C subfamily serine protease